jgi:hypothetical protein
MPPAADPPTVTISLWIVGGAVVGLILFWLIGKL